MLATGGLRWTNDHSPTGHGRLVMPVYNPEGEAYGYVARKLDNQPGPKTLSMINDSVGSWYLCSGSSELIVVEDQLSAIRASEYMNAVALLGTNLADGTLREIKAFNPSMTFIALDKDAFPLSIKMAHKVRKVVPTKVIRLTKDLKDMKEDELVFSLFTGGAQFPEPEV